MEIVPRLCPAFSSSLAADEYDMDCEPSTDFSPYHTRHFLPFGTLVVSAATATRACGKHWHSYSAESESELAGLMMPGNGSLLRGLSFLIAQKFVAATFRCDTSLVIRIYLIPFDLANVEGTLRRREATALNSARHLLRDIMAQLHYGKDSWDGNLTAHHPLNTSPLSTDRDTQSFVEIYNTLPSPVLNLSTEEPLSDMSRLSDTILRSSIAGLRTRLYSYQRRSVAFMAQKELNPGSSSDPLYVPTEGLGSRTFYIQPSTLEVLQNPPIVTQSPGGILCEELGTGKTVMILALILATIDRLSNPEESILDPRPILTPLALQYFPFPPFRDARHKFAQSSANQQTTGPTNRIPSLTEILLHRARTHPTLSSVQNVSANFPLEHLQQAYQNNTPFYHHYDHESLEVHRASRKSRQKSPRVMYLTSATLVIVPATLHHQWSNEINKHCDHTLKYLVVEENGSLPPAQVLAGRFDLILMSHTRFSREARKNDLEKLYKQPPCRCSVTPGQTVRVPNCVCGHVYGVSPLLQIRWKRLVIDEGHVASAKSIETNLMTLVKHISVQYKWIVTGTPTTNLMGLRFGENSNSADATNAIQKALQLKLLSQEGSLSESEKYDGDGDAGDTIEELELQYPDESTEPSEKRQRWTKQDRHDLKKLGNMLVYFLEVPRFASEPSLFTSHVIDPLMHRTGALPGSVRVLRQVMESVMIRHRVEDIENEVTLPPLQQETILLDMDPYAVMTYNVMQSSVVINAVDSERVGSDYLLHSDNVKELRQTIENISQAMFWHVDDMLFSVEERVSRFLEYSERAAQKLAEGKISKQDFDMLQKALEVSKAAAHNPVWKALNLHPNVFSRVYNMPSPIYRAWSSGFLPDDIGQISDMHHFDPHYLMVPDRLKNLRMYLVKKPLSSVPDIINYGNAIAEEDLYRHQINMDRARTDKSMTKHERRQSRTAASKMEVGLAVASKKESFAKLVETQAKRKALEANDQSDHLQVHNTLYSSSPIAGVEVRNTTSSKLNYILNEIQLYASTAKFLVFSRSPLTLMYIAEALAVVGVPYKHSIGNLKSLQHDVMTFETSETYRVFLMELKYGARGLNMVSASRVIFCEPVWQADMETQAIKRVHRIGQVSPVSVKTLAIRDTHEEFMVTRREDLKRGRGLSSGKLPELADDASMRDFIAHPTFLPDPEPPAIHLCYPLLPSVPLEHVDSEPLTSPDAVLLSPLPGTSTYGSESSQKAQQAGTARSSSLTIRIPPLKSKVPQEPMSAGTIYFKVQKRTQAVLGATKDTHNDRREHSSSHPDVDDKDTSRDIDQDVQPRRKKARMNVRFAD